VTTDIFSHRPAGAPLAPPLAEPDLETLRQKSNELRAARRRKEDRRNIEPEKASLTS